MQGALSGDVGAAQQVSQLFQQAIAQGASFFGSTTDDFANFEQRLRELVGSVPGNVTIPPEQQTAANTQRIADSAQVREQSDLERLQAAINIVDTLGILSEITGTLPSEISDRLPIAGIIEALTGEVPDLTGEALSGFFDELVFETNQQLNELGRIEQVQIDQLSVMGDANEILRGIFDRIGGLVNGMEQFAGAVTEASGTIGGDVNFGPGGGGPALADGGIVTGPTRALIGEAGPEAVIPLQRGTIKVQDPATESRLARIEQTLTAVNQALLAGNTDRRTTAELIVERQDQSLQIQNRKLRTDKADVLRPANSTRAR